MMTEGSGGLYIHIPFCKQACTYCNFHFSTSLKYADRMVDAIIREMEIRSPAWPYDKINTVYLGGGTPSILSEDQMDRLFEAIARMYALDPDAEVTLEANPDDLTEQKLSYLQTSTPVNRLSIGIQSFFDEHLRYMNRSHTAEEARKCVDRARAKGFDWFTIDLIYGFPLLSNAQWQANLDMVNIFGISHLSSYQLTVEERTALHHGIQKGKYKPILDETGHRHFEMLMDWADQNGWMHYEISNLARDEHSIARHNSSYWLGVPYLGLGPSAHSFDMGRRYWTIANNALYMKSIESGVWPGEEEELSEREQYNEWVMTRLRTTWGLELDSLHAFPAECHTEFEQHIGGFIERGLAIRKDGHIKLTRKGRHVADRIASELMVVS